MARREPEIIRNVIPAVSARAWPLPRSQSACMLRLRVAGRRGCALLVRFRSTPQGKLGSAYLTSYRYCDLPLRKWGKFARSENRNRKSRLRFPGPFEQGGSTAPSVDSTSVDADRTSLKSGKVCSGRCAKQEPKCVFKKGGIPPSRTPGHPLQSSSWAVSAIRRACRWVKTVPNSVPTPHIEALFIVASIEAGALLKATPNSNL
jgi:hypothetical protein